ncbi:MAG: ferritin family protein [Pseudomonadota bacterium]
MPMIDLPEGAPPTIRDAFAHIGTVTSPTVLDLKVMVLVEAASQELYRASAGTTDHPQVIELLHANAREEFVHAQRASKAISILSGENFPAPDAADNPYLTDGVFPIVELTPEALRKLAETEFGGEVFYGVWADNVGNPEAAQLLRQNGKEETDHGNRLLQAAELLGG